MGSRANHQQPQVAHHPQAVKNASIAGRGNDMAPSSGDFDTSNSVQVRKYLRTHGLLPPNVETYELESKRALRLLESKSTSLEKYQYLSHLRHNNVHLFYRLMVDHLKDLAPIVYTPGVGEACQKWSEIYQFPEGMYLSWADRGSIASILQNWPEPKVDMTVVTDGSRILGLGDLGINGMGIPVGKLALYTGCAGIHPHKTLPLMLDLGTNNQKMRDHPLYMGSRRDRVSPEEERDFQDELMLALNERWPGIVVQFEDFKEPFPALERYKEKYTCFNDDIQGTGSVILAGVMNAIKKTGVPVKEHRAVFMGAGGSAAGVARQIIQYFIKEGLSEDEAKRCFWLVDSKGLITNDRGDNLAEHKKYFARTDNKGEQYRTLADVVEHVKPTMLMGMCTIGGVFNQKILTRMGQLNEKPIIFPLSNPSDNSECTFQDAMQYTEGRALFASGSPFPPLEINGQSRSPGQGNNMYVFPGIGLGAIISKAVKVTDEMIYASAEALSASLTQDEKDSGYLYPEVARIRNVSILVARGVIRAAQKDGVDRELAIREVPDDDLEKYISERMYDPRAQKALYEQEVHSFLGDLSKSNGPRL